MVSRDGFSYASIFTSYVPGMQKIHNVLPETVPLKLASSIEIKISKGFHFFVSGKVIFLDTMASKF